MGCESVSVAEAAEMCQVSPRTARRDLEALSRVLPLISERDGNAVLWRVLKED